ncbi:MULTISPECIES: TRAP transporter substrate-binding protein DctP [unclassified Methylobacterium]|jgi:TRAP-type C4-dicarboxylate transport system substrate-binding protein|uniref:TRAP transporter substrate-binding protein DctP n=1 Tax=unclassified Methylobacterium TaxID=2615210 RepID=UPI0006C295CA|nr:MULTISPECIES: TRAP transporter substrate-binding protein DctP [unclassified Methylobacterium]KOX59639.1 C4-dicarboxylate ABC transporter [Streptomyces purpurogeneiscleroticus]SFV08017.1 TRAP-type C4-dicarboxylate transport system, substrate-binding protein [Methylobacterium sp. UNCCL125]
MIVTRRNLLGSAAIGAGLITSPAVLRAQAPKVLRISHQFPGGTLESGDARDRICRRFGHELEKRTGGSLTVQVYPGSSLVKTLAQFSAVRKGAVDLSLVPLSYAGGELPEANIALMPALVTNYDQAARWRTAPVGERLAKTLNDKGVMIVTWVWQSGAVASRVHPILVPSDVKGVKIRGGGREMDLVFQASGAIVSTMPSSEMYIGMQTGALEAAVSASTSLISFRLDELTKNLTAGRGRSFWFILEPLIISKATFEALTPEQQRAVQEIGQELEAFSFAAAKADDEEITKIYAARGAKIHELTADHIQTWREAARDTAWKDFAGKNASCAELLRLAEQVQ